MSPIAAPIPRRGQVWLAYTPGQPDDPHQPRPVLVVSEDVRNERRDDLMVVPVFSRGRLGPTRVQLTAPAGGLYHGSVLFCEELTTIDRDFLESGPLGRGVDNRTLRAVILAVRRAIGDVVA